MQPHHVPDNTFHNWKDIGGAAEKAAAIAAAKLVPNMRKRLAGPAEQKEATKRQQDAADALVTAFEDDAPGEFFEAAQGPMERLYGQFLGLDALSGPPAPVPFFAAAAAAAAAAEQQQDGFLVAQAQVLAASTMDSHPSSSSSPPSEATLRETERHLDGYILLFVDLLFLQDRIQRVNQIGCLRV